MMRLIYADPGLRDNLGHHANSCRVIRHELSTRGVEVVVLALAGIIPALAEELGAVPFFRAYTYGQTDGDPICGWLNTFDNSWRATVEDLNRMQGIRADDIVYLNSAQPAQLMALVNWAMALPMERRPQIVLEFGTDPGIDIAGEPGRFQLSLRDYRRDPRAMFYRFAAGKLGYEDLPRFHMVTFDQGASEVFAKLLNRPVGVLPLPQFAHLSVASRVGHRPVTVAALGHQRPDKGFHAMPEVARLLLDQEPDVQILLHNGAPGLMAETQAELRTIAAGNPRLVLDERVADSALWQQLLARSDLIVCPYEPARFVASYSAVATEAVANAIPLVVPARTSLSRLLETYGNPGTCFATAQPAAIVAAIRNALADFDAIAARAMTASEKWNATMGVANMVTALLELAKSPYVVP
jgi:glycosyltransferase involved in cell wall biosynthesis